DSTRRSRARWLRGRRSSTPRGASTTSSQRPARERGSPARRRSSTSNVSAAITSWPTETPWRSCSRAPASVVQRPPGTRRGVRAVGLDVLNVPGLLLDPLEPRAQVRVRPHVDPGLVREMRVAVDRDVRDRVTAADEELARGEVVVQEPQDLERAFSAANGVGVVGSEPADEEPEAEAA